MMENKQSHNKFLRFATLPIRALGKARDFYVRSMIGCADFTTSYGNPMTQGTLPKSFSARSTRSSAGDDDDDYNELVRAASVRSMGHLNEIDMLLKQHQQQSAKKARFPKSTSAGMAGLMGRIEEENPGDIADDGSVHAKKNATSDHLKPSVYPRSKSVAVALP